MQKPVAIESPIQKLLAESLAGRNSKGAFSASPINQDKGLSALGLTPKQKSPAADSSKKKEARDIAEKKLVAFIRDKEAVASAMSTWLDKVDRKAAVKSNAYTRDLISCLTSMLHSLSSWRVLKQGPESVKEFIQARVDLAERVKVNLPKEAVAWAKSELASDRDLKEYLPEMVHNTTPLQVSLFLASGKDFIVQFMAEKIAKLDDMDSWTNEDIAAALFERTEMRTFFIDEIYRALTGIYVSEGIMTWIYFDSSQGITSKVITVGVEEGEADSSCQCESCVNGARKSSRSFHEWAIKMIGGVPGSTKVWGEFSELTGALNEIDFNLRGMITFGMIDANSVIAAAGKELIEAKRLREAATAEIRRERKLFETEKSNATARINQLSAQLAKARATPMPGVKISDDSISEELKQLRKTVDSLREELSNEQDEHEKAKALLSSLLSPAEEWQYAERVVLSPAEIREKRGVIIGGHYTMTSKLRKELPNCTFYSPDAKSLDENAVRNSDYLLFCTGYVNHCLTGHAMKLSRQYSIPCGYTERANISLIMQDIGAIFSGE